ncbi:hypothetical protein MsAc7_07000 [Methanolapillus millepedarum]|uniref:Uncharacterized protein n=1 Tax=Methanolapillus millepedarum TaxID=3028296 RepID=A0AA96V529_9EURY|nr:hypothetical protein MsAc7_07000 [Methanosarcinaceae archaeon Ac7]
MDREPKCKFCKNSCRTSCQGTRNVLLACVAKSRTRGEIVYCDEWKNQSIKCELYKERPENKRIKYLSHKQIFERLETKLTDIFSDMFDKKPWWES